MWEEDLERSWRFVLIFAISVLRLLRDGILLIVEWDVLVCYWYESSARLLVEMSKVELVRKFCDVFCNRDEQFVREVEESSRCCGWCTENDKLSSLSTPSLTHLLARCQIPQLPTCVYQKTRLLGSHRHGILKTPIRDLIHLLYIECLTAKMASPSSINTMQLMRYPNR